MAIWDLRPKTDVVTGVAVGVGVIAAPVVLPVVWSIVRPVLKAALKSGFMLYETGRGVFGDSIENPKEAAPKAKGPRKTQGRKKTTTGRKKVAVKVLTPEAARSLTSQAKSVVDKPKREKEQGTKETPKDES